MVILKGSTEKINAHITYSRTTCCTVVGMEKDANYTMKAFATNDAFEGPAAEKAIKYEGTKYGILLTLFLLLNHLHMMYIILGTICETFLGNHPKDS